MVEVIGQVGNRVSLRITTRNGRDIRTAQTTIESIGDKEVVLVAKPRQRPVRIIQTVGSGKEQKETVLDERLEDVHQAFIVPVEKIVMPSEALQGIRKLIEPEAPEGPMELIAAEMAAVVAVDAREVVAV